VVLLKEFEGKHAEELVKVCPKKVFDIEDMGQGRKRATVARPRDCSLCRECIRDGVEWEDQVDLRRVKNHFICKKRKRKTQFLQPGNSMVLKEILIEFLIIFRSYN
jgi:hypothetical protein